MLNIESNDIQIQPVQTRADRSAFVGVALDVYSKDSPWLRPLNSVVRDHLDQEKNPFYQMAEGRAFLARQDGKVKGRIMVARCRRYERLHGEKVASFGLFECTGPPSVASALLDAATSFAEESGASFLRGPFNITAAQEIGVMTGGFDQLASIDMAYTPPAYIELFEQNGFTKCLEMETWRNDSVADLDATSIASERHQEVREHLGMTFRPIDRRHRARDLELARELVNAAFLGNWGFVPITREEWQLQIGPIAPLLDPSLILFAEIDHVPVGVTFATPDFAPVLRKMNGKMMTPSAAGLLCRQKAAVVILFAVRKQYQGFGVSRMLNAELVRVLQERGYERLSITWITNENTASRAQAKSLGMSPLHRLAMVEKTLR